MNRENETATRRLEQQRTFIIRFMYWSIIAVGILAGLKYAGPVLSPFIIAFVIAWATHKPVDWFSRKTQIKRPVIAFIFVTLLFVMIGGIVGFIGTNIFLGLKEFFTGIPAFYNGTVLPVLEEVFQWLDKFFNSLNLSEMVIVEEYANRTMEAIGQFASTVSTGAITAISSVATTIPGTFIKTIITLISTVFISMDYHKIMDFIGRQFPEKVRNYVIEGKDYIGGTILKYIKSYSLIILMTFVELWLGFSLIGIPNAVIIAALIAVVDILPVLGTGGVLIPWAIIAGINSDVKVAVGMVILYLAITIIRNIVEPKLVGQQVGLHPVVTLASMLLGLFFFGFIGLFGVPILVSLLKNFNDRGIIHILK